MARPRVAAIRVPTNGAGSAPRPLATPDFTARSLRTAGAPPAVAAALPRLLAEQLGPDDVVLKPRFVYRVAGDTNGQDLAIKLYPRRGGLGAKARPSQAKRAVEAYLKLFPIASPKPVFWDRLDHADFESVLACEFAEGPDLRHAWKSQDAPALSAVPGILAELFTARILHGDLHGRNLIWSKGAWLVIDLDGIRSGIHGLRRRTIWERTWARLLFDLEGSPKARALFDEFLRSAQLAWSPDETWTRIHGLYDEVCAKRAKRGVYPGD
ncbi:MAG: hypothetical protein ACI8Q9_001010 [Planctomycetota bacterium]|jgi:hypothetical protein